jgi:tRNA A-37 threonylcarbamoyl transferase component Bud32
LAEGTTHCPRCGPGSLALFSGEHLAPGPRTTAPGREEALARALGRHYRVVRLLGRGGFAEVYEVMDEDLHRRLAVKVLRDDLPWSAATLARFKQEARAIARLSHPNTLPIHFVGEADGLVFYVMPYCEGRTLADILRTDGALAVSRALAIAEPILETLQHAHEHGLVHRDVKPDNILIESSTGRPLLVDFGIVKYLDGPVGNTQTGFIVGTPLYMSPEQALGRQNVDARTDVYGMGVVMFQMLTGAPPFSGADSQEIVSRHLHEPVPVATLSRDRVPPWLSAVIQRCLAKHPDDRYPDARGVLEALRAGRSSSSAALGEPVRSEDETPTAAMPGAVTRPRAPIGRRRALVALGLLAAVGVVWASVRPRPVPMARPASAVPLAPTAADASLLVHNRLTEPIALTLEDTSVAVGPGDSVRLPLRVGQELEAHWAMVRPGDDDGDMLGAALEGTILSDDVRGDVRGEVVASGDGRRRFSPMVVNGSRRALTAAVILGRDTTKCGRVIAPGDSLRLGYYSALPGSQVRVGDSTGATARFYLDPTAVDSVSGSVVLRVNDRSLLRPPAVPSRERRRRPEPANPLKGILPVR